MTALLQRLRAMPGDELRFRLRQIARRHTQRIGVTVRRAGWNRRHLARALSVDVVDAPMREAIRRGDWSAVEGTLRRTIARRDALFVLDPRSAAAMRARIAREWPDAPAQAAAAADAIAAGFFNLLGFERLSFASGGAPVDWHFDPVHGSRTPNRYWADIPYLDPAYGDHKIIWELNRHQHFLTLGRAYWLTGDRQYANTIVAHLDSWLKANPPLVGVNWASALELAFRCLSWIWALHFLLAGESRANAPAAGKRDGDALWLIDMLVALDRQLTHVEQNLSRYFSPNTHLTGEALALYVAGTALPELRGSQRWRATGRSILLQEIDRQICADGGHAERSTHYHRYTLDFYLLALLTAERSGDLDAAQRFRSAAIRLTGFMEAFADATGRIPLIGDDDGGVLWPMTGRDSCDVRDSLSVAHIVLGRACPSPSPPAEEAGWLAGAARPGIDARLTAGRERDPGAIDTRSFPETGYVVMRTAAGDLLTFDAGPHGYLNAGHSHADALSVTLAVNGQPLLIDPGTATYTMDPDLRDRMRATASHNTLTIDGRPSARPRGPFHWQSRADARLHMSLGAHALAHADASHDGYAPIRHRRSVLAGADAGWLIVDEVTGGSGHHTLQTHWHFAPAWEVSQDDGPRLLASCGGREPVWLLHDASEVTLARGDRERHLGWCSPRYGVLVPTWTARLERSAALPATLVTWIAGARAGERPALDRQPLTADADAPAVAVRVTAGARTIVALLRPGDRPIRDTRSTDSVDYHTNARVLQYVTEPGRLRLSLADGSHALALRDRLLSVSADDRIRALHVLVCGERLDLWAAHPPDRVHLQGEVLAGVRTIALNGRDWPAPQAGSDALTFGREDWGARGVSHVPAIGTGFIAGQQPLDAHERVAG